MEIKPLQIARSKFKADHPGEPIAWIKLLANEVDRFVVGVFWGTTRPPRYLFYAVSKQDGGVVELADGARYLPKNWR